MNDITNYGLVNCLFCGKQAGFTIQKLNLTGTDALYDKKEEYSCEQFIMKCGNCKKFIPIGTSNVIIHNVKTN